MIHRGPRDNSDATRMCATKHYRDMLDSHLLNQHYIATQDMRAIQPPQMWMLALDPAEMVARALEAELFDPNPADAPPPPPKNTCGCRTCNGKLERGT